MPNFCSFQVCLPWKQLTPGFGAAFLQSNQRLVTCNQWQRVEVNQLTHISRVLFVSQVLVVA